jgi:hypothetical protein
MLHRFNHVAPLQHITTVLVFIKIDGKISAGRIHTYGRSEGLQTNQEERSATQNKNIDINKQKGIQYNETGRSSPAVNEASIFIILILIAMTGFMNDVNDVKGGTFSNEENLYMEVPQGFHLYYGYEVELLLMKTLLWPERSCL